MRRASALACALLCVSALALHAQTATTLARHSVLGAGVEEKHGVQVNFVRPGSPAARARLQLGDSIVAIGKRPIDSIAAFVAAVKAEPAGVPIPFEIRRANASLKIPVVLDAAADEADPLVKTIYGTVTVNGTLRRTLVTVPAALSDKRPAVLILGGIGCFTVDNPADREDAYMRLAHDLGRRGIVTMRLEKSGVGDSEGPPCMSVDLLHEMNSYRVALDALRNDPHVDPSRIYLFGHSIGTLMTPRIANESAVAGVIIAEGVGRNWFEYELENLRRQLELAGEPADKIDVQMASKEICMHRLLVDKEGEEAIERTMPDCREHNTYPAPASYMQQAAALNVAEPWMRYSLPLLVIYGTADFVTEKSDHERIAAIVNAAHPGLATLKLVPGMDHHFDKAGTEQEAYDLRVKRGGTAPYDEDLSAAVLDWLCAREACTIASVRSADGAPG